MNVLHTDGDFLVLLAERLTDSFLLNRFVLT